MTTPLWLDELTAGDRVIVIDKRVFHHDGIGTVVRLTKTQIVVQVEKTQEKFYRTDGYAVARSSSGVRQCLQPYSDAQYERIAVENLRRNIYDVADDIVRKRISLGELGYDECLAILSALRPLSSQRSS